MSIKLCVVQKRERENDKETVRVKYLGFTINDKLTCKDHVTNICLKVNSSLGILGMNLFAC